MVERLNGIEEVVSSNLTGSTMLKIGIIGLPNVGKSTLFNALTKSKQADAQNYPFCTIEPNMGVVEVPDERLEKLGEISKSEKIIPTTVEFVDIAGLVKGASEGEGLGNKFLSHIREVDAIAQVVRIFSDKNVTHVHDTIDAERDLEVINLELALADLETINKQKDRLEKEMKAGTSRELEKKKKLIDLLCENLVQGKPIRDLEIEDLDDKKYLKSLHLLTNKPMMIIANTDEINDTLPNFPEKYKVVQVCAKLEQDLSEMTEQEAKEYLSELGIKQTGLDKVIKMGYDLLNLITFLTSGEKETRAWTVQCTALAPQAAGVIHTDFEKGFIRAEIADYDDFVKLNGWVGTKENGKMRLEGKEYEIKDGDVCYFRVA